MDIATLRRRVLGDILRGKIGRLKAGFEAASAPFYAEIKALERETEAFQKKVDVGEAQWDETTDDGDHFDYGEEFSERRDDALDALLTLRHAFTFLVYHQWERLMQRFAKPGKPNHEDLVKAAKAAGIALDEPGLEVLRLLVNTIKHNSTSSGPALYKIRRDLFKADFDPSGDNPVTGKPYSIIEWSDQVVLTDKNIEEFLEIVINSSPR